MQHLPIFVATARLSRAAAACAARAAAPAA